MSFPNFAENSQDEYDSRGLMNYIFMIDQHLTMKDSKQCVMVLNLYIYCR